MSRTALVALSSLVVYCSLEYYLSTHPLADSHSLEAQRMQTFRDDYLSSLLGPRINCVEMIPEPDGWIRVRYVTLLGVSTLPGCDLNDNRALAVLATPGRHEFREVRPGAYVFGNGKALIGKAPAFSPAFSLCFGSDCRALLLDPRDGLGFLPGEFMSDNRDSAVTPGRAIAHELGHWPHFINVVRSKAESVEMENWYNYSQNPVGPLRLLHDATGFGLAPGKSGK